MGTGCQISVFFLFLYPLSVCAPRYIEIGELKKEAKPIPRFIISRKQARFGVSHEYVKVSGYLNLYVRIRYKDDEQRPLGVEGKA